MKKIVPALYSSYGRYIDEFRAIPNINDCLKPVERRSLYSLHKTAQKLTKSAKVVGDIIGMYHPHGDACLSGNTNIFDPLQYKFITFKEAYENNLSIPVLCYDSKNNKISIGIAHSFRVGQITNKYIHLSTQIYNKRNHILSIYATSNHPFFVDSAKKFIKIEDLTNNSVDLTKIKLIDDRLTWSLDDYKDTLYNINLNYSREIELNSKLEPFHFIKSEINDIEEQKFYDFTVDKYENMLIPIYNNPETNTIEFIITHNSTYDAVVSLVNRGFAIGQGNFGYNAVKPVSAAAYRYTEVKINPDLDRIAFELIKFAPYSDPELLNELQPDYIPCPVPIGLVGDGMINGISFNVSRIPRFNLFDLFNRLTNVLQRQVDPSIKSLLILPNFPNFDIYEEAPGELEKLLTTGKGTLILKPHYKVDGKGVHVYGRPPLGCSGWLKEDTDDKKMKYACDDLSGRQGFEALFTPKNGARMNQEFVDDVLNVIETKIHFVCNVWDDSSSKVITQSIDELLLNSYNKWCRCYKDKLEFTADKIRQQIREMIIIELIRYLLHNYSAKIVTINDVCNVYNDCLKNNLIPDNLSKDVTEDEIIIVCKKHSISKLFDYHVNKQEQENNLQQITNDLNNFAIASFNFAKKLITNS